MAGVKLDMCITTCTEMSKQEKVIIIICLAISTALLYLIICLSTKNIIVALWWVWAYWLQKSASQGDLG